MEIHVVYAENKTDFQNKCNEATASRYMLLKDTFQYKFEVTGFIRNRSSEPIGQIPTITERFVILATR